MKYFVVFLGAAAHGSACSFGEPLRSRTLCCVTGRTGSLEDTGSRGSFPQTHLWGSREPAFPGQGAQILSASHYAKFLVSVLANTSAPFWLLVEAILSYFCRDGHLHCIHVSLPSIPPMCFPGSLLHSHSGEGFCKAACTSTVVHQDFFLQVHHASWFSYFWGCPFLRKLKGALCEERASSAASKWNHLASHLGGSFSAFSWFQA